MIAIVAVAALLLAACAAAAALAAFHRTGELISPWILFLGMAALDIFLPAAVQAFAPDSVLAPGTIEHFGPAVAVFVVAALLFAYGYGLASAAGARTPAWSRAASVDLVWAEALLVIAVAIALWRISADVFRFDTLESYLTTTLTTRFTPRPMPQHPVARVLFQATAAAPMCAFICIGVLFVHRRSAPLRYGVFWPLAGLLLAATTFFRGTILMYLLGLLVLETLRRREEMPSAEFARWSRRLLAYGAMTALVFVSYGSIRNWMIFRAGGGATSVAAAMTHEVRQFSAGHGLRGLASIIDQFPSRVPYLEGKTFVDMLLLPVPRTIWSSKPEWYGIDEITRAMGWPPTSQSAVTMPGELWANFGIPGLALMIGYGMFFGAMHAFRAGPRLRYIYAFQIVPLTFITFWMGFTAMMNAAVLLPIYWALLCVIVRPAGRRPAVAAA